MKIRHIVAALLVTTSAFAASENLSGLWRNHEKNVALVLVHDPDNQHLQATITMTTDEGGTITRTYRGEENAEGRKVKFYATSRGWSAIVNGEECEAGKSILLLNGFVIGDFGSRNMRADVTVTNGVRCGDEVKVLSYNLSGTYK